MGTHTVRTDCIKCRTKESFVYSFESKNPATDEAFCLSCGCYYSTVEKKLSQEELKDLRKEYEWKERDKK